MTRTEHLGWAKERALEYLDAGDIDNAYMSLVSDMNKHKELFGHAGLSLGHLLYAGGILSSSPYEMRKWIVGFN